MESIQELFKVDFSSVFLSVFVVLAGLRSSASLLEWAVGRLGLETRWKIGRASCRERV